MRLPAEAASVAQLLDALEGFAETAGLGPRAAHHLALVAEELAANVAMHGAPRGATFFAATVRREGDLLHLVLEDDGPAFDPLARQAPDTTAPLEARDPGGLGVLLVRRLSRQVDYARAGGHNRVTLALDAQP